MLTANKKILAGRKKNQNVRRESVDKAMDLKCKKSSEDRARQKSSVIDIRQL